LEEERRALAAFVTKFDSLGLKLPSKLQPPKPTPGGALTAYAERRQSKFTSSSLSDATITRSNSTKSLNTPYKGNNANIIITNIAEDTSPIRPTQFKSQPRLLDQVMPEEADMSFDEFEVEQQLLNTSVVAGKIMGGGGGGKMVTTNARDVFGDKENILPEQV
jgi:centromeric protein E